MFAWFYCAKWLTQETMLRRTLTVGPNGRRKRNGITRPGSSLFRVYHRAIRGLCRTVHWCVIERAVYCLVRKIRRCVRRSNSTLFVAQFSAANCSFLGATRGDDRALWAIPDARHGTIRPRRRPFPLPLLGRLPLTSQLRRASLVWGASASECDRQRKCVENYNK